jgi:preprotein translocase subunit SecF
MLNIIGKRYWFFALSALIIIPGIIVLAIWGLPFSIDFKGGNRLEVQFPSGKIPDTTKVYQLYTSMGITDASVYTSGTDGLVVTTSNLTQEQSAAAVDALSKLAGETVVIRQESNVGPVIGQELSSRAIITLIITSLMLVAFITFSFRGIENAWHYGIATVVALIHDVLVIISIEAIGSRLWGWQVDTLYLTALLTVIAFSAQDTIVVFDRMRENSVIYRRLDFETLMNHSIVQTLSRSINTQFLTADFLLLALALFGGVTLKEFAIALIVGMISGSYSSIFIAAPVLVIWKNKEWRHWFRRNNQSQTVAP